MSDGSDEWEDYESGPFCPHWDNMSPGCEVLCKCGHPCKLHEACGFEECTVKGCDCKVPDWEGRT